MDHISEFSVKRENPLKKLPAGLFLLIIWALLNTSCHVEKPPLKIAIHPWVGYQSMVLADQQNLLDKTKISLIQTESLSESAEKLLNGEVDAAALTLDEVLQVSSHNVDLEIVLIFDASAGADLLIAKPGIDTIEDLKGKTIGMEDSALSHLILNEVLEKSGLTQNDIHLDYDIVKNHEELWNKDTVDVVITYLPLSEKMAELGKIIFDSHNIPNTILDVLAIRKEKIDEQNENLKHLLISHFKITDDLRLFNPDILHRLSSLVEMDVADTSEILRKLDIAGLSSNYYLLSPKNPYLKNLINKLEHIMALHENINHLDYTDTFLPEYTEERMP